MFKVNNVFRKIDAQTPAKSWSYLALRRCLKTVCNAVIFTILGTCLSYANDIDYFLKQFSRQEVPGVRKPAAFVRSYEGWERFFTYDQALAAIVFTHAGDKNAALKVLNALANVQEQDGSWNFSYPKEDKRSISGAIAWVLIAMNTYRDRFGGIEFDSYTERALSYLERQRVEVNIDGEKFHPIRFSSADIPLTPWDERLVVAFEHNIDAYSAFKNASGYQQSRYGRIADDMNAFTQSLWNKDHFYPGYDLRTRMPNKEELYLDTQSWGVLSLGRHGLNGENFAKGLARNCKNFFVSVNYQNGDYKGLLFGFMDFRPVNYDKPERFVWSEGSLGMILAIREVEKESGITWTCNGRTAAELLQSIRHMITKSGGVAYASPNNRKDFSTSASIAGTAWYYFVTHEINPFDN
ncbi:MAG: hypothetical protein AABZ06_11845 [Bdellovibrionota bacterium]